MNLKKIVTHDNKYGRIFEFIIHSLIIISLIGFTIETEPNLSAELKYWLYFIEVVCIIIFTLEYLLRVIYAENTFHYIFSFYGMIDFLAIIPFYISSGVIDFRSIRIFRLFRLIRAFKLLRFSKSLKRFENALKEIKSELLLFLIATLFLLYVSSVGIYYFEHDAQPERFSSIFQCLWWAVATLTTVGYGDVYPVTIGGRLFTSFIVIIGIGIVAVPTGLIASAITKVINDEHLEENHKEYLNKH